MEIIKIYCGLCKEEEDMPLTAAKFSIKCCNGTETYMGFNDYSQKTIVCEKCNRLSFYFDNNKKETKFPCLWCKKKEINAQITVQSEESDQMYGMDCTLCSEKNKIVRRICVDFRVKKNTKENIYWYLCNLCHKDFFKI